MLLYTTINQGEPSSVTPLVKVITYIMSDFKVDSCNKKKLMIVVPSMHQGGQERVVVRTSRLLEPYFDITIVIFDGSDVGYDTTGLNIINIDVPAKPGKFSKVINIIKRTQRLRAVKKQLQPDISYSYGPSANMINALSQIKEYKNKSTDKPKTWVGLRNYTDATFEKQMKLCISKSDLVICCARDIETEVKNRFGTDKTAVLYNLYDIPGILADAQKEEPDTPFEKKCRYICSMGRDDDQKMFWHMLRAFKVVQDEIPEARLVILGAGTWNDYKKMAKELEIDEYVLFAGQQSNPYRYLKYGEINWMTTRNEGFPNALVEGMALGLAAVCTNCLTGPAEILIEGGDAKSAESRFKESLDSLNTAIYGEYGILTPELSRERDLSTDKISMEEYNVAQVIIDLLRDEERLKKYKEAAASRAQDFTYDRYLEEFLKLSEENYS